LHLARSQMALARATRAASSRAWARSDANCRLAALVEEEGEEVGAAFPPAPGPPDVVLAVVDRADEDEKDDDDDEEDGPLPMVPVPLVAAALLAEESAESITTRPSFGPPYHSFSHFSAILHT